MPDRFLNLTEGVALIVTDLHGDRDAFDRCLELFSRLYWRGDAQYLIFLGDLIHGYGKPADDSSVKMVLDLIALRNELGAKDVIMLLGNHEMPHIYGVSLAKGDNEFTPRFEHALGHHRERVLSFFESLPFYVRTKAGVMLAHAGPALDVIAHVEELRHFDHRALLDDATAMIHQADDLESLYRQYTAIYGIAYDELAHYTLAIKGQDDPRYSHLLRALLISERDPRFKLLWDTLITQNEMGVTERVYVNGCQHFLRAFSVDAPAVQQVIVSGHIVTPGGGHKVVNRFHLRVSTAAHARPREAGEVLLLDCARPVDNALTLVNHLRPLFGDPYS